MSEKVFDQLAVGSPTRETFVVAGPDDFIDLKEEMPVGGVTEVTAYSLEWPHNGSRTEVNGKEGEMFFTRFSNPQSWGDHPIADFEVEFDEEIGDDFVEGLEGCQKVDDETIKCNNAPLDGDFEQV